MLYTAYYLFTVGEVVPRSTTQEFSMAFLIESVCMIVNAVIIGYMSQYMDELNKKSAALSAKINLTNTAMINLGLSRPLKTEISKFIYNTHTTLNLQEEMNNFLDGVKATLKAKVIKTSFVSIIEVNSVMKQQLKERTDYFLELSQTLKRSTIKNARAVFRDKLITCLVSQFDNVFTAPDGQFMLQDDEPYANPNEGEDDDE